MTPAFVVPGTTPSANGTDSSGPSGAGHAVAENLKSARAAWPSIRISDEVFFAYVAERLAEGGLIDAELVALYGGDLYLACACANGDATAMMALEELFFGAEVDAACRRSNVVAPDEMRQRVRAKLFVGPTPKIASYAGRSSLRTWLRAVVGRLVIDAAREQPRDAPAAEVDFFDLADTGDDPDQLLLKRTYRSALQEAFALAAKRLAPRDRNLLRYALSQGLNIDQIGSIYGVHRVTAARWLQAARASLAQHIQAVMTERMRMSATEFDSVVRLVMSQIDVTFARVFTGNE